MTQQLQSFQMYIDGQWTDGSHGHTMQSINPATGKAWASFACTTAQVECIEDTLEKAKEQGVSIVFSPTLVDCPTDQIETLKVEMFGPVMSIVAFDTVEEAVAMANPFVMR